MDGMYKKLNQSERKDLFKEVLDKKIQLHFKFQKSPVYRTKLFPTNKNVFLAAKKPANLPPFFHMETATIIIPMDQERYFFTSQVFIEEKMVHFKADTEVFHLHRRKNRRLVIPAQYPAFFMVKRVNDDLSFLKAVIGDISDGGCKLHLNSEFPSISFGQTLLGTVRLGTRRGIELKGAVRHHRNRRSGPYKQSFGIEFVEMSPYSGTLLANQLLDLQRDLFDLFLDGE